MVVSDSAVHFEQALAHARQLEEKRRVAENYNDMQAVESVRVTARLSRCVWVYVVASSTDALADFKFLISRLLTWMVEELLQCQCMFASEFYAASPWHSLIFLCTVCIAGKVSRFQLIKVYQKNSKDTRVIGIILLQHHTALGKIIVPQQPRYRVRQSTLFMS